MDFESNDKSDPVADTLVLSEALKAKCQLSEPFNALVLRLSQKAKDVK